MGHLRVFFPGVCTHLREFTSRETEHRVVLVNARDGKKIHEKTIVGHQASLRYLDRDKKPQVRELNGVHITVNAVSPEVSYDSSFFTCMPRLTAYAPSLPSLSEAVIKGRDPELVAAYFDAAGRFVAAVEEKSGAALAVLDVVTQDPPTLTLQSFGGGTETIALPDEAHIQIENVGPGTEQGDHMDDFLLNFLVAQFVPDHATVPSKRAQCAAEVTVPFPTNTVDPGCSNSNYP